ncbi:hypothetical protein BKA80DRAFT_256616 [Phyllosticta citrichinensis]
MSSAPWWKVAESFVAFGPYLCRKKVWGREFADENSGIKNTAQVPEVHVNEQCGLAFSTLEAVLASTSVEVALWTRSAGEPLQTPHTLMAEAPVRLVLKKTFPASVNPIVFALLKLFSISINPLVSRHSIALWRGAAGKIVLVPTEVGPPGLSSPPPGKKKHRKTKPYVDVGPDTPSRSSSFDVATTFYGLSPLEEFADRQQPAEAEPFMLELTQMKSRNERTPFSPGQMHWYSRDSSWDRRNGRRYLLKVEPSELAEKGGLWLAAPSAPDQISTSCDHNIRLATDTTKRATTWQS